MKKIISIVLSLILILAFSSCKNKNGLDKEYPKATQAQAICKLAVMECYYHNVAKFYEKDAEGILWWQKDKHFWIEYSATARVGVDASLVDIVVNGTDVEITLPEAQLLGKCEVDLSEAQYIVASKSADVDAVDEVEALRQAQEYLNDTISNDKTLLASAQQRAQMLLEEYITNIGDLIGEKYNITWIYIDNEGNVLGSKKSEPKPEITETTSEQKGTI